MVKITFFSFWKEKEKVLGRKITASEVALATGLSRNTLTAYLDGKVERPDLEVVSKLCKYFDVPTGCIPFLVYEADI